MISPGWSTLGGSVLVPGGEIGLTDPLEVISQRRMGRAVTRLLIQDVIQRGHTVALPAYTHQFIRDLIAQGDVIRIAVRLHRQQIDLEQIRLLAVEAREAVAGFLELV